jgi:hypothetical protein
MDAPLLTDDFKEFLRLFNAHRVEYLVVGGVVDIDGTAVPFISLADLRANKRAAGRHKDLNDLENLP